MYVGVRGWVDSRYCESCCLGFPAENLVFRNLTVGAALHEIPPRLQVGLHRHSGRVHEDNRLVVSIHWTSLSFDEALIVGGDVVPGELRDEVVFCGCK